MLLELEKVDIFYGSIQAVWEISFGVNEREIVSLVGGNGAGKSTILKSISGLNPPRNGRIIFQGEPIHRVPAYLLVRRGIVQIPEGRKIWPNLTVLENLELGAYGPTGRKNIQKNLNLVFDIYPRLRERVHQMAGTLSGGEQQMLAIGRGLMCQPVLLMLDEPSLGLAPKLVEEMFNTLQVISQGQVTILLVEQNLFQALSLASRGYVLETGKIVLSGASADLVQNRYVREAYLGL